MDERIFISDFWSFLPAPRTQNRQQTTAGKQQTARAIAILLQPLKRTHMKSLTRDGMRKRIRNSLLPTLLLLVVSPIPFNKASSSNSDSERYSSLPPTVFAPDGRLYSVERAAQRASDAQDTSSTIAIALHCGVKDLNPGVIVLVSLGPCSPHVHFTADSSRDDDDDSIPQLLSLLLEKDMQPLIDFYDVDFLVPRPPISILHSPQIVAAMGGTAVDSAILLRRIQEISAALFEEHDTLVSVSNQYHRQAKLFTSHTLARHCADLIQLPTQTTGGKTGRILTVRRQ